MNGGDETEKVTWRTPLVRLKVLISALLIAFVCYGFFTWILWPVKVSGQSMMPNYEDGSRHFINKLAYVSTPPQRGDVVGVRTDDGEVYIKRIVGMPGEKLHFEEGEIVIDGKPLQEPYIESRIPLRFGKPFVHLGPQDYFVIGDNRATSIFRPVRRDNIIGKVVY
jgi:signal peptidase I